MPTKKLTINLVIFEIHIMLDNIKLETQYLLIRQTMILQRSIRRMVPAGFRGQGIYT